MIILFFLTIPLKAQISDSLGVPTDTLAGATVTEEVPDYFDKIYGHPDSIELRHVPSRVVDSLKNDQAFWYANAKLKKRKEEREVREGTPKWIKVSVWTIVVGVFLAALVWYLVSSNIVIFANRKKRIDSREDDEGISDDIFSINYHRELEKAIGSQNYRLAIRLMFLRLLRNLSDKNIIQYRQERTNFEYLNQVFSTDYYDDFFRLTRNYEYAWYGKFEVTSEAFGTIKNDFENFDRQLK